MSTVGKVAISLPVEILKEIDELAKKNFANRSHTIVRVFQEWKLLRSKVGNPQDELLLIDQNGAPQ